MNLNRAQTVVLTTLISSMLVLSSGCQSGGFKPDLGRLAFWKKDEIQLASQEIPPPSAHFSPDKADSKGIAQAKKQNLKQSVDAIIAEAKRNKTLPKDPMRKPYSLDSIDPQIAKTDSTTNDFVGRNSLQNLTKSASTAVKSTQDALRQAGQIAQNPGGAISGLQQRSQHAASQIASGVSQGLASQANNLVTGATGAANDFLNTASNRVQQTVNTVQSAADNSFRPAGASSAGMQSNPYLGALNGTTKDLANTGTTSKATEGNVAKAVNNVTLPDSKAPKYQMVTASDDTPTHSTGNALQPLNNPVRTAANTATLQTQPSTSYPSATYPSTQFGAIQPVQQSSATLPAALQNGTSSFAPGSTKPLQPLR